VKPETGRAAVMTEYGVPMQLMDLPVPEPEPGALVVTIDVATVCGTDVHLWEGHLSRVLPVHLPLILGHEMVGIVTAVGDGADRDSIGEAVGIGSRVVWAHAACQHCLMCTVDRQPSLCPNRYYGHFADCSKPPFFTGAFGEYCYVVPAAQRLVVPDDVESAWAAASSCALRTVMQATTVAGRVDFLDSVVVQGAGPVGLFTTAAMSVHGPRHLIVIGGPDDRLEIARAWGATHTISIMEHPDPAERLALVRSITGAGPTVAFEASGAPGAVPQGVDMMRPNGRYILIGTIGGDPQVVDVARITTRGLRVTGSFSGEIDAYYKALQFLRTYRDRFDWDRMLGRRYGLGAVTDALNAMKRMEEMKPVIVPSLN